MWKNWLITLDFGKYIEPAKKSLEEWINDALQILYDYAVEISPTDTKEFIQNHKIIKARTEWNKIIWTLENDTEYAIYLEYGVQWKEFNYYKWPRGWSRTRIHIWVGNRTYTRTIDDNQRRVFDLILSKINLW